MIKEAGKLLTKFILGVIMCLFVFFSFEFAITAGFSETVGYEVRTIDEVSRKEISVCYHDAENNPTTDCKCSEYDAEMLNTVPIKELSNSKKNLSRILAQIFSTVLMTGILYGTVWEVGNKDISAVKFGRTKYNLWRGAQMGLLASIPTFVIYLLLVLSSVSILKPQFLNTYRLLNSHFHGVITWIYNGAVSADSLTFMQILLCGLLCLYLPLICGIAYLLGYKDISLFEKSVFKKR